MRHYNKWLKLSPYIIVLILCLLSQALLAHCPAPSVEDYISRYKDVAIEQMAKHQIPASITLAQGILESRYGNSHLAVEANNHFGIKCHDWTGPAVYADDDAKGECFRAYNSAYESFEDHSAFLKRNRYEGLFDYKITDYKRWARGLSHAGYATNPKYADQLIDIIERYNLDRYDSPEQMMVSAQKTELPNFRSKKVKTERVRSTRGRIKKSEIFYFNRIKSVVIERDASLQQISNTYNISVRKLRIANDLEEDAVVPANSRIYLHAKRARATYGKDVHRITEGENMAWIAHEYGVKLSCLYKKNKMSMGQEPMVGELIQLRQKTIMRPKLKDPSSFEMYQDWTVAAQYKKGNWNLPAKQPHGNTSLTMTADASDDSMQHFESSSSYQSGDSQVRRKVVSRKRSFSFDGEKDLNEEEQERLQSDYGVSTRNSGTTTRVTKEWGSDSNTTRGHEVVESHPDGSSAETRSSRYANSNNRATGNSSQRVASSERVSTTTSSPRYIDVSQASAPTIWEEDESKNYNSESSTVSSDRSTVSSAPSNTNTEMPRFIYRVKKGDTLYSLGRKLGVSVTAIKLANGLTDNTIKIGQELTIPQ